MPSQTPAHCHPDPNPPSRTAFSSAIDVFVNVKVVDNNNIKGEQCVNDHAALYPDNA